MCQRVTAVILSVIQSIYQHRISAIAWLSEVQIKGEKQQHFFFFRLDTTFKFYKTCKNNIYK